MHCRDCRTAESIIKYVGTDAYYLVLVMNAAVVCCFYIIRPNVKSRVQLNYDTCVQTVNSSDYYEKSKRNVRRPTIEELGTP
jgi:hypothetical protein